MASRMSNPFDPRISTHQERKLGSKDNKGLDSHRGWSETSVSARKSQRFSQGFGCYSPAFWRTMATATRGQLSTTPAVTTTYADRDLIFFIPIFHDLKEGHPQSRDLLVAIPSATSGSCRRTANCSPLRAPTSKKCLGEMMKSEHNDEMCEVF